MVNDFTVRFENPIKGSVTIDNGVLVVKDKESSYGSDCYLKEVTLSNGELKVTYQKRNWEFISYLRDNENKELVNKALPEYIETIPGYYKRKWFGNKWIPEKKKVKEGFVEFQPNEYKTVITNLYRIFGFNEFINNK